jgi:hypothetical protein
MARTPARGPGPLPAIVGGVIAALVLLWLVGIVIGTFVFFVKVVVLVALVWLAFRVWAFFSAD